MHPFLYGLLVQASRAPMRDDVPPGGPNDLLTPGQTSKRLKIAKQTLARWRVEGKGPRFVRLGNRVFYRNVDLEAFLTSRVFSSTAEADRGAV